MRYGVLSICVLLAALFSVNAADAPPAEGRRPARQVGGRRPRLPAKTQLADGAWGAGARGDGRASPAVTSLCVMAFLSAGHVPGEGRYGETVEKGIRWVLRTQQPNGLFAGDGSGGQEMYHHGICTLMLAEAAGMTDGKLGEEIRKKLVKAVDVILTAQRTDEHARPAAAGATPRGPRPSSDISVTGWQIMALRAAKNVGCDVPAENIDEAVAFIKRCQDANTGGFDYQPGSNLTVPCTGTGILALEICGKDQHHEPRSDAGRRNFLAQEPAALRDAVRLLRPLLLLAGHVPARRQLLGLLPPAAARHAVQEPEATNGSWIGGGDGGYGPNYSTAMCVLALTVEYRYLPIYQRGEEPTDK